LDAKPAIQAGSLPAPTVAPDIILKNLTYRIAAGQAPIVTDLSHVFPVGSISALIGRSGSGKSTLLNLIAGLRPPSSGCVLLGDTRVDAILPSALRRTIIVVSQFPLFIADSVRANFQLGKENATDPEIEATARATGLWPILMRHAPESPLDMRLGPGGQGLSGGERRLFAITRGLLSKPMLLLLDEPTTGIDAIGVGLLQTCLKTACQGITVIMVDHNLDFVRGIADCVCCLEGGQFTSIGTPAVLSRDSGSLLARMLESRGNSAASGEFEIESYPRPKVEDFEPGIPPKSLMLGQFQKS
jgi:ABC-type multidrug transport system fused ATPase/permease subunit